GGAGALLVMLAVVLLGELLGGGIGGRVAGGTVRDSLAVGSLMNARGMIELIVMKVGLDAGLFGPELFRLLLLVALCTTLMTGPLLALLARRDAVASAQAGVAAPPDGSGR